MGDQSVDARLARIEEKIDGLDRLLTARCAGCHTRIGALEKSCLRQGERLGKLEAVEQQRRGGKGVLLTLGAGLSAVLGALGALTAKLLDR
jgi:hypothetical protein